MSKWVRKKIKVTLQLYEWGVQVLNRGQINKEQRDKKITNTSKSITLGVAGEPIGITR